MSNLPNFTDPQFVDANGPGGLNAAFTSVSGSISEVASGAWATPGLISPESAQFSAAGLVATVGLPSPWGLISSGGMLVRAHGTTSNQDTQNYTVNFAPFVPNAGSITAFLAATITQIQQNPVAIPGPPQGHPSFNAAFVPTVGFATNVASITLSAVTGGIDNINTFELFRTTLTAGSAAFAGGFSTVGWARAASRFTRPVVLTTGGALTAAAAQGLIQPTAAGLTSTLPSVSGVGGLVFSFSNPTSGSYTLSATGTDLIGGAIASGGVNSMVIPPSGSVSLAADPVSAAAGFWSIQGISPNMLLAGNNTWTGNNLFTRPVTILDPGSGGLVVSGTTGAGVFIELIGNGLATTAKKFLNVVNGVFNILSNAGISILSLTDAGVMSVAGAFTAGGAIFANGGRLRATLGATGSGDADAAAILSDFGSSLVSPGFQNLPSGLIIQWGSIPSIAAGNSVTVNYSKPFPNGVLAVVGNGGGTATNVPGVNVNTISTGPSQVVFVNQSSTAVTQIGLYIAIGH